MPAALTEPALTTLITGASSGIGEALAHRFAEAGHRLVLVARNQDKLKTLAKSLAGKHGIVAMVQVADLSKLGAAARLATTLERKRCAVNVLVNNAGVVAQGSLVGMTPESQQQMIALNITGLTSVLSAFVPGMVARAARGSAGHVLNVASIAAFLGCSSLCRYGLGSTRNAHAGFTR